MFQPTLYLMLLSFPFNLNNAVDQLLKDEFDSYRGTENNHPYLIESSIDAKPYDHPDIEIWRTRNQGIGIELKELNLYIYGLVDDVWINTKNDKLIIADYKATSKKGDVTIDAPWQISYKRQIEIEILKPTVNINELFTFIYSF